MRDFAKLAPQFWIGETGRKLRGHPEAQIVAAYLISAPSATMIGLYYLPIMLIAHETGLPFEGASKGLRRASEAGFCDYDESAEVVWVYEMARFQIGDELQPKDNRCVSIQKAYDETPKNKFLPAFYEKYAAAYHLKSPRLNEPKPKGLRRGFEGASEALRTQKTETETETDNSPLTPQGGKEEGSGSASPSNENSKPKTPAVDPIRRQERAAFPGQTPSSPEEIRFERFWKAYPRPENRPAAVAAFARQAIDEATLGLILADIAARRESPQWTKDDGTKIPHPSSYLDGRRWLDEPIRIDDLPRGRRLIDAE
jgi:hypothetical protein